MKKLILAIACLFPLTGMAQGGYTISGKLIGLKMPAKAYLITLQGNAYKDKDSVEVRDGKFTFTGNVIEPQQALLAVKPMGIPESRTRRDYTGFFLENSDISFTGTDSIKNATVSGSKSDKENKELEAAIKPLSNKIQKLNAQFSKYNKDAITHTAEERKTATDSVAKWVAEIKDIRLVFVQAHLQSFMGLYAYNMYILDSHFDPAKVEPLFHKFSPELQESALGKRTLEKIEIGKKGQAGVKITDFTQNDLEGKPFTLSSLRGKYVLLDFWASWCAPCRAENPNVRKAYRQLKDKNFEIVSVSLDAGKPQWVEAIKKDDMPWIHVCDFKGWKNDVAVMYGITAVPQNFLISPQGIIIAKNLRGNDLTEKLSALIK